MTEEEHALVREIVRSVIQEEVPELLSARPCLLEAQGLPLYEHREHHMLITRLLSDIGSTRKAFLMGIVTTVTGGVLGLVWLFAKGRLKGFFPWLQ